ncbi:MAG: response regulator [Candidatus Zixiibacteriota bacterium]|nr:MAG: response regulator [candidate division Zixibacteria bacterium]
MIADLFTALMPLLILSVTVFLTVRLGYFGRERVSGRFAFLFGGIFITLAAAWHAVENFTAYNEWFVQAAYPVLDFSQLALVVVGVFMVMVGLAFYADHWQTRREEIESRDERLSILTNLQADAREPYQTIEFLEITVREIVSHFPDAAGAVFMVNRTQRQLVLASAAGFTRTETAGLERYPYGRNVISQAIEMAEPVVSSTFEFVDRDGHTTVSRFASCLVLPMISVSEKIGAIVLVSEKSRYFGRSEIRYLSPVTGWLAEVIRASRLSREIASVKRDSQRQVELQNDFTHRVAAGVMACATSDAVTSFCRSLVGLASSQSVQLVGMKTGALHFYGGSEPILELSENYRTALIDGLDRRKPLIINQEASGDEGRSYTARSTLLYPLGGEAFRAAIMLVREGTPFRVDENELRILDVFSHLARLSLKQSDIHNLDITRRRGLDKILQLLRFDRRISFAGDPGYLVDHLGGILPPDAIALTFARQTAGSYRAVSGLHVDSDSYREMETLPGEGIVGSVAVDNTPQFVFSRSKVGETLRSFDDTNRDAIQRLFGERGLPNFLTACPITSGEDVAGVVLIFMYDISESERAEWSRLLTLAAALYSVRLTTDHLHETRAVGIVPSEAPQAVGEAVNRLNNHLSAIIGNAGLAEMRTDLSGEIRNHFRSIVSEAEHAARFLRDSLGHIHAEPGSDEVEIDRRDTLNDVVEGVLSRSRISDNLYMVGGGPREISRKLSDIPPVAFAGETVRSLFEEAVNRFAAHADDEDVITIATYLADDYIYLDISRHHRDFPPVQNVARFGRYQPTSEALRHRPADTFLKHVDDDACYYSFDRVSPSPSYLSFKFPVKAARAAQSGGEVPSRPRILAIDDQPVILDLISAMCQTAGYDVKTAHTGDEGLQLALSQKFDIILTDLAMPGLSGIEIAHEIRKKKTDIPIVLVTGWEVNISREKMEAAGITRVLYKPFRIEQLTDLIDTLVHSRSTA